MSIYCTYFTFYSGNKMPPFYIGSSRVDRIENGYRGSPRSKEYESLWKSELKSNPHLFKIRIISKHSTRGDALQREAELQKKLSILDNPLYINRSIARRGFGQLSSIAIAKIRDKALKRNYDYMRGKNHHFFGGRTDNLDQAGGKNPYAKKCKVYGQVFDSIQCASLHFGISYKKCYRLVRNKIDNSGYLTDHSS